MVGHPASHRAPRCPRGTRGPRPVRGGCPYGTLTLSGRGFHRLPVASAGLAWVALAQPRGPTTRPGCRPGPVCHPTRLGCTPVRSPLLRGSLLTFGDPGTKMFQFPGSPRRSRVDPAAFPAGGFPIRASADRRLRAPPRRVSSRATPFLARGTRGIPRVRSSSSSCEVVKRPPAARGLVGPGGVEPPPSRLSGERSAAELWAPAPVLQNCPARPPCSLERR